MDMKALKYYLDQTWEMLSKSNREQVLITNDPMLVKRRLSTTLPLDSEPFEAILKDFQNQIEPFLNINESPNFGAYITGSGTKISAFAEFIKAWYNQNGLKWNNSPIASELEQLVIRWVAEYVKLPTHNEGFLTSGGSMSNLMALHLALAKKFPERELAGLGAKKFTVYCSNQTHSSVDRAMVFLGLGRDQLRKIAVNQQYEVDVSEMRELLEADIQNGFEPLAIIGNAGTTNTGSIDDLNSLAKLAGEFDVWYHVDGAYGLPAIRLHDLEHLFLGVQHADSVVINPHKWMYVTFEASCLLVKHIPQAIHFSPDYLFTENPGERWESSTHTIELSKEFRALKIWFTLKYFGADQLTSFVKKDIQQIDYLAKELSKIEHIAVEPHHPLSILCFRYAHPALSEEENERRNIQIVRQIESEGKIFITGTKLRGKTYLRVYFGNPERTDEDVRKMILELVEAMT
jgi:aromatic-L-amino-acid decarboxylase